MEIVYENFANSEKIRQNVLEFPPEIKKSKFQATPLLMPQGLQQNWSFKINLY